MQTVDDLILDPIERGLDSIGLMQGSMAPLKRTAVGGAIGYAYAFGMKPAFAFNKDGSPKEWSLTASTKDSGKTTLFPWWAIVATPAIILGVLI
jgi:hypothetical protein